MTTLEIEHRGGCLCGQARFVAKGPLRDVVFCHCSQCRKQTGLYYAATGLPRANLAITGDVTWYRASDFAERGFCGRCGSALFWYRLGGENISVLAGAFDDPAVLAPGYHICTEGRATFYGIADGLVQHPQSAPGLPISP